MKRFLWPFVAVLLGLALLVGGTLEAADGTSPASKPAPTSGKPTPGVEVAQAISTITGVAISPLLGVGAIGAWKFWKTAPEKRAALPWFAQPWFWIPALLLVIVVFLKDTAGAALPTALKKPLDIAELFENKISALVAAGAFIPIIATIFQSVEPDSSLYQGTMMAAFDPALLLNVITIPVAITAFLVVWMVSHVINVLILVSPFSTVDAALKSVRLALLSTVTLTSFANPYVGAAWALVIIIVSYFLSGWALRLMVFGTTFAWDLVTFRHNRFQVNEGENWVFTARSIDETPIRSFGRLSRGENGHLVLRYRPWLVLPQKQLVLPAGTYAVGRGLVYPEVMRLESDLSETVLTLPPRYRGHEEKFGQVYRLNGVEDVGFKALWAWLKGAVQSKPAAALPAYPS